MNSCHGNEFTPLFREDVDSEKSNSDSGEGDDVSGSCQEGSEEEIEDIDGAFADAKDCWKVDSESLRCFYLHSPTRQLFSWDQARGVLYEYVRESGECRAIWAAGAAHVSSEIWTILPLPPTDPASMQTTGSTDVLCILHLCRHRAATRAATASADFCERLRLDERALDALLTLPPAGQAYVLRTFCAPASNPSGALIRQVQSLRKLGREAPYASAVEETTLRVPASGAILGRCVPEIEALCWNATDPVASAHCRISCLDGGYAVCDLVRDEDGTLYDGRRLGDEWCALKDGCDIDMGPIRMHVELRAVEVAAAAPRGTAAPQRGAWRAAKRGEVPLQPKRRKLHVAPEPLGFLRPQGELAVEAPLETPCSLFESNSGSEPPEEAAARPFWAVRKPDWIPRTP